MNVIFGVRIDKTQYVRMVGIIQVGQNAMKINPNRKQAFLPWLCPPWYFLPQNEQYNWIKMFSAWTYMNSCKNNTTKHLD